MASSKLSGKDLKQIGFPEGRALGTAQRILEIHYKGKSKKQKLELLGRVVKEPHFYKTHETLSPVAHDLLVQKVHNKTIELSPSRVDYTIWGEEGIEAGAINQMEIAMKLPVSRAGALMPDAHQGYGLPIGGVLATENAVIPYGVGVDIGCRMALSVYSLPDKMLNQQADTLKQLLVDNTRFGQAAFRRPQDHAVLERPEFKEITALKTLKDKAWQQLGSSGGGNHFVEWGVVSIEEAQHELNLSPGNYVALLSHSGSRGLGANIARHYTKLAMDLTRLPGEAKHLAWLDLDTQEGQEYWLAMNLAGDYAAANHQQIHARMAQALGEQPLAMVENHHNFAWKETDDQGNELVVHRKGATPAGAGVLGIIPGSMTSPGFIVRGKGLAASLNSASHGAGRLMSRSKAKEVLSLEAVKNHLQQSGVEVLGSGLDEAPMVYKDIHQVMAHQQELVAVLGTFSPKIVRMCGDARYYEVD
ncbi:MAG: RtcB family protein [Bacteroidetes bacterium]|nr:RtcB family protein [Bacteroidota bacterium]